MLCLTLVRPRLQGKAGDTSSAKMGVPTPAIRSQWCLSGSFLRRISSYWVRLYGQCWGFMKALHLSCMLKLGLQNLRKSLLRHLAPTLVASSCNHLVIGEHRTTQTFADTAGKPIPYTDQWFSAWSNLIYSLLLSFLMDPFENKDYCTLRFSRAFFHL